MKYVIDFEDTPTWEEGLRYHRCKQAPWWSASDNIINRLEPYDQESAYKKGLEDAWEAARRIADSPEQGGLELETLSEVFGPDIVTDLLATLTAEEAIAKLKAYDEEQNSIKVGDEVENTETLQKGVVYEVVPDQVNGFYLAGRQVHFCWLKSEVRKTGRHFDEVDRLLERMREG